MANNSDFENTVFGQYQCQVEEELQLAIDQVLKKHSDVPLGAAASAMSLMTTLVNSYLCVLPDTMSLEEKKENIYQAFMIYLPSVEDTKS